MCWIKVKWHWGCFSSRTFKHAIFLNRDHHLASEYTRMTISMMHLQKQKNTSSTSINRMVNIFDVWWFNYVLKNLLFRRPMTFTKRALFFTLSFLIITANCQMINVCNQIKHRYFLALLSRFLVLFFFNWNKLVLLKHKSCCKWTN